MPLQCLFYVPDIAHYPSTQLQGEMGLISCTFSWVWFLIPRKPVHELIRQMAVSVSWLSSTCPGAPGVLRVLGSPRTASVLLVPSEAGEPDARSMLPSLGER